MKNCIYILAAFFVSSLACTVQAQESDVEIGKIGITGVLGTKIGGTAPLSMPKEIRSINSYKPNLPFFVGVKGSYQVDQKWAVLMGLTFEGKGMDAEATVKGYKTTFSAVNNSNEELRGFYTGDITTKVHNLYLTIPVQAAYQISKKWNVQAGPYVSFAVKREFYGEAFNGYLRHETPTGTKIVIDAADYDFASSVRTVDVGMSLGGKYAFNDKLFALAQFDYGFNNIMKTGFESISFGMHNIFMNVGVGYKLR